jgi:hypothetical protein
VGYGKTLMLFHMLRLELGDATFIEGLQSLYQQYRFRVAGFTAVEQVFSAAAGRPLDAFFEQWVQRSGAPRLRITRADARPQGDGYVLSVGLEQRQPDAAYVLQVPIAVQLEGESQAYQTRLRLDRKHQEFELELPARPLRLEVDPEFDVFRRLHRNEIPPSVSQALGAERILIVLPGAAPETLRQAYASLARSWQGVKPDRIEIVLDNEVERLPVDRAVWLFGWRNRFRAQLTQALAEYDFHDGGDSVRIDDTVVRRDEQAVVVLGRNSTNPEHALGWLAAGQAALPGLGRKLPHYGKYSYLAFTGDEPVNVLKGQWPVVNSPLSVRIAADDAVPVAPGAMRLAPRTPLVALPVRFSTERMQRDIETLAAESMRGRGLESPELAQAATYIAGQFRAAGLQPGGDGGDSWLQVWQQTLGSTGKAVTLKNVVAVLPGSDPERAGESLVIGAHYDHLGYGEQGGHAEDAGRIHPGADDNASGIAVMLELARVLAGKPQPRSIVFVAFTGEESGRLGSRHYVQHTGPYPVERIIAMVNVDTVGRLGKRPLTVFGTATAAEWVHILRGAGYVTGVPIKPVADDMGSSDQTSFIEAGVPAVQLFSGVHEDFHRPGDTADKIDVAGLVKTARVLQETVEYLAGRPEALHSTIGGRQQIAAPPAGEGQRRVSLGTVPEYAFSGEGVQIAAVRAGTPAAQAGLRPGDVIIAVNKTPVHNLREYAQALKALNPGDEVLIGYRRNGTEHRVRTHVVVR